MGSSDSKGAGFGSVRSAQVRRALTLLPDEPKNVEVRGLLLAGATLLLGPWEESVGSAPYGLVLSRPHGLAVGFGDPGPDAAAELLEELSEQAEDAGLSPGDVTLHVPFEAVATWASVAAETQAVHRVRGLESSDWVSAGMSSGHPVERIESPDDPRLQTLARDLRADFEAMEHWPVAFAALAGGAIASMASASVETEGYFDVSIETSTAFRGDGFGRSAASALIEYQLQRGKRPVWIVRDTNKSSLALSTRLGFVDLCRMVALGLAD